MKLVYEFTVYLNVIILGQWTLNEHEAARFAESAQAVRSCADEVYERFKVNNKESFQLWSTTNIYSRNVISGPKAMDHFGVCLAMTLKSLI